MKKDFADPVKKTASEVLKDNVPLIMNQWMLVARKEIVAAAVQSDVVLRDSFDKLLLNIAYNLEPTTIKPNSKQIQNFLNVCKVHGQSRAVLKEYSLEDVVQEYRVLRIIFFDFFDEKDGLNKEERTIFLESIDVGISTAALEFSLLRGKFKEELTRLTDEKDKIEKQIGLLEKEKTDKEQFVLTLTHDFRTPITSAKTCAELILMKSNKEPSSHSEYQLLAKRIINDLARADRMIKNLLDSFKIKAGEKLPIRISNNSIYAYDIIKDTIKSLSLIYGDRFHLNSDLPFKVYWNYDEITRVLENLLINAVKYGNPKTIIKIKVFSPIEGYINLSVNNQGTVLSENDLSDVFSLFKTKSIDSTSWGIGLTLVKGIVESHGGKVLSQSNKEEGTTFTVILPIDARTSQNSS